VTDERHAASTSERRDPDIDGSLFWTDDGWLVDLREYRHYPIYGEWEWLVRTNNSGVCFA
jgi:hypothetical protein